MSDSCCKHGAYPTCCSFVNSMKEISFFVNGGRQTIVRRQSGIHVSTKRQETKNVLQTIICHYTLQIIHLSVKPFLGKQIEKALFQLVNLIIFLKPDKMSSSHDEIYTLF